MKQVAIFLIVLSLVLFGLIFVVPFLSLTTTVKTVTITVLVIVAEIAWWVGVALIGKEFISKYLKYLNPLNWFKRGD